MTVCQRAVHTLIPAVDRLERTREAHLSTPQFQAPYAGADEAIAGRLMAAARRSDAAEHRIDVRARRLVEAIRSHSGGLGGIEDFLHAYSLSTKEGLALMVLAEALLRVPDAMTADALIEDKLAAGDWSHADRSGTFLVSASAWTLGITAVSYTHLTLPTNREV